MKHWVTIVLLVVMAGYCLPLLADNPPGPPPADKSEIRPASPGPDFIWVPGHWVWKNHQWDWLPGHWQKVRSGYTWVPAHWVKRGRRWVYVPGRWKR